MSNLRVTIPIGTIVSPRSRHLRENNRQSSFSTGRKIPSGRGNQPAREELSQEEGFIQTEEPGAIEENHHFDLVSQNSTRPFILKDTIAEGSYGAVYKAVYCQILNQNGNDEQQICPDRSNQIIETDEYLAVKIMTNQQGTTIFNGYSIGPVAEIDIMSRLKHPNLLSMSQITIVDFMTPMATKLGSHPQTTLAISMPLAISNLADYATKNPIPLPKAISYLKQILSGLDYLHAEEIIHLDLKLENVLLMDENHAVLADFGLSVYTDQYGFRELNRESITITYRPPEFFSKEKYFQRASDVWSFGMLALYLFMGVKHIFTDVKPRSIKRFLSHKMNDRVRRETLEYYLGNKVPNNEHRQLIIDFLDRCLAYQPKNRSSTRELLHHPLLRGWDRLSSIRLSTGNPMNRSSEIPLSESSMGNSLYPMIWTHPSENICLDVYSAIEFLIRMTVHINPLIEVYFLAIDFFHRSLAHLHILQIYFRKLPLIYNESYPPWKEDCSLTEILSLGALTSFWIALKAIDDRFWDVGTMSKMTSHYFSAVHILEMERQLVTGLKGIIYRWNLFKEANNSDDLIEAFEISLNVFEYPNRQPSQRRRNLYSSDNKTYQFRFNDIYPRTRFYRESITRTSDDLVKIRYSQDRTNYFSRIQPGEQIVNNHWSVRNVSDGQEGETTLVSSTRMNSSVRNNYPQRNIDRKGKFSIKF